MFFMGKGKETLNEMAEKPEDQYTSEEKIAKAKELYARGCRNYYVGSFSEAADDLSEASKLYGEEFGVNGDELGDVYLMYAKALVAIGQEENKLIDVPDEEDDSEDEEVDPVSHEVDNLSGIETNGSENGVKTNGHDLETPQAGPSGVNDNESSNDAGTGDENDEAEEDGGNLELAWEVLLNAAAIFERQGNSNLSKLMDVYTEMGGISLENGNFEIAIKDFNRALDVFNDLEDSESNQRIAAELNYKIGLCLTMLKQYDESVKSFQTASDLLDEVVSLEKAREDQTEKVLATIKDLQETQQEILNKITEIGETKAEEIEQVKKELAKMFGPSAGTISDGAGGSGVSSAPSTSSSKLPVDTDKQKPTDISHLIKRKKPDNDSETVEASPAKRQALQQNVQILPTEKLAVDDIVITEDKIAEESTSVEVIDN